MKRFDYISNKKSLIGEPRIGQIWAKKDKSLYIRLDKRLCSSHNVYIWSATFEYWHEPLKTSVAEKTLLADYELFQEGK